MNILAFDTTTSACAAAVCRGSDVLAERAVSMERGHAEALLPMLEAVLADASLGYVDLDKIAVTRGPGAFTGIRIGLAAARGLSLASGVPAVGVTTLEAMAATTRTQTRRTKIAIIMDTKRRDYFVQAFGQDLFPLCDAAVLGPSDIDGWLDAATGRDRADLAIAGDGLISLADELRNGMAERLAEVRTPAPQAIAALAAGRPAGVPPTPVYLRPPEARLPSAGA